MRGNTVLQGDTLITQLSIESQEGVWANFKKLPNSYASLIASSIVPPSDLDLRLAMTLRFFLISQGKDLSLEDLRKPSAIDLVEYVGSYVFLGPNDSEKTASLTRPTVEIDLDISKILSQTLEARPKSMNLVAVALNPAKADQGVDIFTATSGSSLELKLILPQA